MIRYIIRERRPSEDDRPRGGHGGPGRKLLVHEKAASPPVEAGGAHVPRGPRVGPPDLEDGGPEAHERVRDEGTRATLLPAGRAGPPPSVLLPHVESLPAVPGGVRPDDGGGARVRREEARAGRGRGSPEAADPGAVRETPREDGGQGPPRAGRGAREDPRRGRLHGGARDRPEEHDRVPRTQLSDLRGRAEVWRSVRRRARPVPEAPEGGCRRVPPRRGGGPRLPLPDPEARGGASEGPTPRLQVSRDGLHGGAGRPRHGRDLRDRGRH